MCQLENVFDGAADICEAGRESVEEGTKAEDGREGGGSAFVAAAEW